MTMLALIIIAISVGFIHGIPYGFLTLGIGMFVTLVLKAILRRIPVTRPEK